MINFRNLTLGLATIASIWSGPLRAGLECTVLRVPSGDVGAFSLEVSGPLDNLPKMCMYIMDGNKLAVKNSNWYLTNDRVSMHFPGGTWGWNVAASGESDYCVTASASDLKSLESISGSVAVTTDLTPPLNIRAFWSETQSLGTVEVSMHPVDVVTASWNLSSSYTVPDSELPHGTTTVGDGLLRSVDVTLPGGSGIIQPHSVDGGPVLAVVVGGVEQNTAATSMTVPAGSQVAARLYQDREFGPGDYSASGSFTLNCP